MNVIRWELTSVEVADLKHQAERLQPGGFSDVTVNVQGVSESRSSRGPRVALFTRDGKVEAIGAICKTRIHERIRTNVTLSEIRLAQQPILLSELCEILTQARRLPLLNAQGGTLTPASSEAVINYLHAKHHLSVGTPARAEYVELRDPVPIQEQIRNIDQALITASKLSGIDLLSGPLAPLHRAAANPSADPDAFRQIFDDIQRDRSDHPLEDRMIERDARFLSDLYSRWSQRENLADSVTVVAHGPAESWVAVEITNRDEYETATGADLMLTNLARQSFALVQYKRLKNQGSRADKRFSVDQHFEQQLEALHSFKHNDDVRDSLAAGRLWSAPGFVKFIDESLRHRPDDLVPGFTLPCDFVMDSIEQQRSAMVGSGARPFFSSKAMPPYLNNTQFQDMFYAGLIGGGSHGLRAIPEAVARVRAGRKRQSEELVPGDGTFTVQATIRTTNTRSPDQPVAPRRTVVL